MWRTSLRNALIIRLSTITAVYSVVSYILLRKEISSQISSIEITIPLLFVMFGVVVMINVMFALRRHRVQ
ncbi:MAG: hypothetical protein ABI361_00325 [Nitrososphaera sp.]